MKRHDVLATVLLAACSAGPMRADTPTAPVNADDPDRQQAIRLYEQRRMPEAASLLETVVGRYPRDTYAHEILGSALVSRAATQPTTELARADRLRARQELLRARELGDHSDLCRLLLAEIPEDGSFAPMSAKADVDAALREGEAAFSSADWPKAIAAYTRAWDLDPTDATAALFLGDTYYATKDMDRAAEWFARSIQANPDLETPYRYWGDALMVQGKAREARARYIEGIVADPYRAASSSGMHKWLVANGLQWKSAPLRLPPAPKLDEHGRIEIPVDASMLTDDAQSPDAAAWLVYQGERSEWMRHKYVEQNPGAKTYRHSLAEEIAALQAMLVLGEATGNQDPHRQGASMAALKKLNAEGLLEPFILLSNADAGLAEDYPAYRDAHRDKLIAYLDEYLVPAAP